MSSDEPLHPIANCGVIELALPRRRLPARSDRSRAGVEDYTNKYKGEQVEIALFGGEYQDGVLTAYCYLEDVAHVELNGHILIPLQNVASLHCSSRCDAPEPDWPPRGLAEDDRTATTTSRSAGVSRRRPRPPERPQGLARPGRAALRCSALAGWQLGGYRVALLFLGSVVLLAAAVYAYADRIVMGMLGARELLAGRGAGAAFDRRAAVVAGAASSSRGSTSSPDSYPRALSAGRGAGGGTGLALSVGLLGVASPAELEGIVAHELAHLRNRDVLVQTVAVVVAATAIVEFSRIGGCAPARAALRARARSLRRSCTCCCRRSASSRPTAFAAELCGSPHGLADALAPARAGDGARRRSRRARRPSRSTRRTRSPTRASRRCSSRTRRSASASAGCASSIPAGARSSARPETRKAPRGAFRKKWAASYSPGGLLPEYHRR